MKKRFLAFVLTALLIFSLCPTAFAGGSMNCPSCAGEIPDYSNFCLYCGISVGGLDDTAVLTTDMGKVKILGIATVPDDFFSSSNINKEEDFVLALVEFTSYAEGSAQFQKNFNLTCFQNGVEMDDYIGSYYSNRCTEYDNFYKELRKNGTIVLGRIFRKADDSPVTIVAKNYGVHPTEAEATFALDGSVSANELQIAPELAELDIPSILCASDWTYTNPQGSVGIMTFDSDGTGVLNNDDILVLDTTWTVDGDQIVTKMKYQDVSFSATYSFVDNNGSYELHNNSYDDTIWTPVE